MAGAQHQHSHRRPGQDHHPACHRYRRPQSRNEAPPAVCIVRNARKQKPHDRGVGTSLTSLAPVPGGWVTKVSRVQHTHPTLHKAWALDPSPFFQGDSVAVPALQVRAPRPREWTASPRPQGGLRGPGRAVDGSRRGSEKSEKGCCPGMRADRKPGRAANSLSVGLE